MRGRIRQLKPEIFLDDEFWELTQEHPELPLFVAFLGLWCFADREGRFEWKPAPLKSQVLPYWQGDFVRLLDVLAEARLVICYTVAGRRYGAIRSFGRHQMPNNRESPSVLPAPGADASSEIDDGHPGFVYVAALPDGSAFKVGFSRKDPLKRVNDISNGSPEPLRLVEFIEGGTSLEAKVHRALKPHNRHREWFTANDESVTILSEWFSRDPRVIHPCPSRAHASSDAASPAYNQIPTPTPDPDPDPDSQPRPARAHAHHDATPLHRERKSGPRQSPGTPATARTVSLPSQEPLQEYLDEALNAGVSREQAAETWKHYYGAGLPPGGVERLIPWMVQRAKERANQLARAGPTRKGTRESGDVFAYAMNRINEEEAKERVGS